VEEVIFKDKTLRLEVKSVGGIYVGRVSEDFLVIEGRVETVGGGFSLTVKQVDKAVRNT